jgi:hypothetical protein
MSDSAEKVAAEICNSLNEKYKSNYFSEKDLQFIASKVRTHTNAKLEEAVEMVKITANRMEISSKSEKILSKRIRSLKEGEINVN